MGNNKVTKDTLVIGCHCMQPHCKCIINLNFEDGIKSIVFPIYFRSNTKDKEPNFFQRFRQIFFSKEYSFVIDMIFDYKGKHDINACFKEYTFEVPGKSLEYFPEEEKLLFVIKDLIKVKRKDLSFFDKLKYLFEGGLAKIYVKELDIHKEEKEYEYLYY